MYPLPKPALVDLVAFSRRYGNLVRGIERAAADADLKVAEASVLLQLGEDDMISADVARALSMDTAQLSRCVKGLVSKQLVERRSGNGSSREKLGLTSQGQRRVATINGSQAEAALRVLQGMSSAAKAAFFQAAGALGEHKWDEGVYHQVEHRGARPGDFAKILGGMVESGTDRFWQGFDSSFEGHALRTLAAYANHPEPSRNVLMIAEVAETVIGSIMAMQSEGDPTTADVQHLWVGRHYASCGIGSRLLDDCRRSLGTLKYARVRATTTNRSDFMPGKSLYQKHGWTPLDRRQEHKFGRAVTVETWELRLKS
jgi:DNA-binding MarR family transcriptional regulator/ribosomal protein S18 acetylase RimI-like enzyme